MKNLTRSFTEVAEKIEATKRVLPKIIANQAQNYFVKSWDLQGFDGRKWKEVKRRIEDEDAYKYPKEKGLSRRTRPILIGETGSLRRKTANSVAVASWPIVKLIVDLPYAAAQNEGNQHLPKRQYIGQTRELTKMQNETIDKYFEKVWK